MEDKMQHTPLAALAIAAAFATTSAFAAGPHAIRGLLDLPGAVDTVIQAYPGRVIAAQLDASGGESTHYHVDVLLPNGKVAKLDVDARTRQIVSRMPPEENAAETLPLAEAIKLAQASSRGKVISAEYDPDPVPHYHMNVRLPRGAVARFDLDISTGKLERHRVRG
jgi:uncharacterized membrane protein YkoI